jgi:4-oxalomesaconate tautomerase
MNERAGIRAMWMRGGTSKGGYFLAEDMPADRAARDALLLGIMGSPDPRQIDGMGGGDPLSSKVAIVRRSDKAGVDVDFLFLQIMVDQAVVTDAQNCGNILAGVGPFAIERGLVTAQDGQTDVRIYMQNTGQIATARVQTPDGWPRYDGNAKIDGCVIIAAQDLGVSGDEAPAILEANSALRAQLESIRLQAGRMMNLGDVSAKSVPKMTLVSAPKAGGTLATRSFIPHRCHAAIGVFGAISVGTAALLAGSVAHGLARLVPGSEQVLSIEHPSGEMTVLATLDGPKIRQTAVLRTARKLCDGVVFA